MDYLPSHLYWSVNNITLNNPTFSFIHETTPNKTHFLLYFQKCMKEMNPLNYNWIIHQNVNAMIQKMIAERSFYLTENNTLKDSLLAAKGKIAELENQVQKFKKELSNSISADLKIQKLEQSMASTVTQNQELLNKNNNLEAENAELNSKIKDLQERSKSVKECEEVIEFKNDVIEKLKDNVQNLNNEKASIIVDFSERLAQEQKMKREMEQKLEEYENRRNRLLSEAKNIHENSMAPELFIDEQQSLMDSSSTNFYPTIHYVTTLPQINNLNEHQQQLVFQNASSIYSTQQYCPQYYQQIESSTFLLQSNLNYGNLENITST